MELLIYTYIALLGLIFGSFFNVVGLRVPKKESLLGRSYCPKCNKKLLWYELIPIFSFVALKGKCNECKSTISWLYPVVELLTAVVFVVSYSILKDNMLEYTVIVLFSSLLIITTVSDIAYKIVPDSVLIIIGLPIVILRMIGDALPWYESVIGGIIGFGFLYLLALYGQKKFKKKALGGGDIKLYFIIGIVLGYQLVFLSLFFASLTGLLYSMLTKQMKGSQLPFVPFIFVGSMITYFFGPSIIDAYMSLFI